MKVFIYFFFLSVKFTSNYKNLLPSVKDSTFFSMSCLENCERDFCVFFSQRRLSDEIIIYSILIHNFKEGIHQNRLYYAILMIEHFIYFFFF
jgi:hypothetical protein